MMNANLKIFVFKTNINFLFEQNNLAEIFITIKEINNWSIDLEDIDKVLRIEARREITEEKLIKIVNSVGYKCQKL